MDSFEGIHFFIHTSTIVVASRGSAWSSERLRPDCGCRNDGDISGLNLKSLLQNQVARGILRILSVAYTLVHCRGRRTSDALSHL